MEETGKKLRRFFFYLEVKESLLEICAFLSGVQDERNQEETKKQADLYWGSRRVVVWRGGAEEPEGRKETEVHEKELAAGGQSELWRQSRTFCWTKSRLTPGLLKVNIQLFLANAPGTLLCLRPLSRPVHMEASRNVGRNSSFQLYPPAGGKGTGRF